jgi:putative acyl-CoA dehydrogenase
MQWPTHDVTNKAPDLHDYNLYSTDLALVAGIQREQATWYEQDLLRYGAELGTQEILHLAQLANQHIPELRTHDRFGNRIDVVEFHPSWHQLLRMQRRENLHAMPWMLPHTGAHVARTAAYYLQAQVESGSLCPITMTFASIPLLQQEENLFAALQDKLFSRIHDTRDLPLEQKKNHANRHGHDGKTGRIGCTQ